MARKHKHEEHVNAEAWAIPYGDLVTLLLAFFVVMYAISSVNEGRFRQAAESLNAAFAGTPKTVNPVQIGEVPVQSPGSLPHSSVLPPPLSEGSGANEELTGASAEIDEAALDNLKSQDLMSLKDLAEEVRQGLQGLINDDVIRVREHERHLEVEIKADLLFNSGNAVLSPPAVAIVRQLSEVLKGFSNSLKVEGHTDNLPINSRVFPSNWELSAGRAASVVHLMTQQGVNPARLTVIGRGEFSPVADNDSVTGRNRNRRVLIIIQGAPNQRVREEAPAARPAAAPGAAS